MSSQASSSDTETDAEHIPKTRSATFITTSGGLLTDQLVKKLRQRQTEESAVRPETFALPNETPLSVSELENEIGEAWNTLRERWDELTMNNELFGMDISDARNKWILRLFRELGFEPVFQRENLEAGGLEANLSHKGWPDRGISNYGEMGGHLAPILHTVEPGQELDEKPENSPRGAKSPHDTLQQFLNASSDQDWAVVTNGLTLRVLRDYYHTYTRGYVEFDLENMFTNRNYRDFRALYRLCHASRFIEPVIAEEEDDNNIETPLERLYQIALSTGVKVGQDLQSNVVSAIEELGNGFLNQEISEAIDNGGQEAAERYYQDILYVVYRLLFLMFAEQRGMMDERSSLYTEEYSVTKLRERSEMREGEGRNTDLWEGLQATFQMVGRGVDDSDANLHTPGYNGGLFDDGNLEFILDCECPNAKLLSAVHDLTHIEHDGYQQRISYADLGVEEIGAVYESLLEFTPQVADVAIELEERKISAGSFYLDDRGMERKETGSYYTDPGLVNELIESALEPVVDERVDENADVETQEQQLLEITVCDPAVGSGAFLIAANDYLGQRLAQIRSDTPYPSEETVRRARRSVVQHCLYGVDLNKMAVELAKVSLWINSAVENKPLSFLDHRIKHGNSLLGTTPELVRQGVPVDAFETSGGRDWHEGNEVRKRVRDENDGVQAGLGWNWEDDGEYVSLAEELDAVEEEEIDDIHEKERLFEELEHSQALQREKVVHDIWTAAFYWPLDGSIDEYPTPETIEQIRREFPEPSDEPPQELSGIQAVRAYATEVAEAQNFFHWPLEFPAVYADDSGFDCLLGNPPWEKLNFEEEQFFAVRAPEIANASTANKRKKMTEALEESNPELYEEYQEALEGAENLMNFMRNSGMYERSGQGHVNTYALFAEWYANNVDSTGRVGVVVPTGISTDHTTADFFRHVVENQRIVSLYDYNNNKNIFPGVHNSYHFCLFTLTGNDRPIEEFEVAFGMDEVEQLHNEGRRYLLSRDDIERVNPNTGTVPTFENPEDAELTLQMYETTGVLVEEDVEEGNPWGVDISRMFNMSDDSDLFWTIDEFGEPYLQEGNEFVDTDSDTRYVPLYESKLIHQYTHRFATFEDGSEEERENGDPRRLDKSELDNPGKFAIPRYWIEEDEYTSIRDDDWHLALRDITNATNERTVVSSLLPRVATGHTLNHVYNASPSAALLLMSSFNSFAQDFVARQKIGGTHLSHFVVRQLPIPSPSRFEQVMLDDESVRNRVIELALRLSYTATDLDSFAEKLGVETEPFTFTGDDRSREEIRFELEALMCHVYGVSDDDLERVFETFEQIKRRDKTEHGYYRTREEIRDWFEKLAPRISEVDSTVE